jgi:tetratricopeptide (TPR) repeat protein
MKFAGQLTLGLLTLAAVIWGAGWVMYRFLKKSDDPGRLIMKWILTALVAGGTFWFLRSMAGVGTQGGTAGGFGVAFLMAGATAACGIILGLIWATSLGELIAKPITNLFDGGQQEMEPEPLYSVAEARRKQGKYAEAIAEIRIQLARFPGDARGTLMLAEIMAEDLNDLPGAETVIEHLVNQPNREPLAGAVALNRLADWQLKYNQDPDTARSTLERIVRQWPDSEPAYLATQRIAHLAPREMLAEEIEPHRLKLGTYESNLGLRNTPVAPKKVEDPAEVASGYVKHLEEFPLDSEAREKLATLYAEHYGRLDLASDQLEQLISTAHAPNRMVVHWLNLLADLHIRVGGDIDAARRALERVVELYPRSAPADSARTRIAHLPLELRSKQKSQVVKLGTYEQNLGLKAGPKVSE